MTTLDDLLATVGVPRDGADDTELALGSLEVVSLVLSFEEAFGLTLRASEIRRDSFATRAALRALLRAKGVAC